MDAKKHGPDTEKTKRSLFSGKNFICEIENVFNLKNKQPLIIILIIGILFMTLPRAFLGTEKNSYGSEEKRLCEILSNIEGAGDVSVMITYHESERSRDDTKKAKGAVVTAGGADNIITKNALSEAVQAALDLPPHKVRVYKKSG